MRATDAAAELVQLREAELVGAMDDDGVGGRDIDAGLDDGRAQQHVAALAGEVAHHPLELALAHLARGDRETPLRQEVAEPFPHPLDASEFRLEEDSLAP